MTRDELEAAIRAALSWRDRPQRPLSGLARMTRDNSFIDDILGAADAYAAGDCAYVTRLRRELLAKDGWQIP